MAPLATKRLMDLTQSEIVSVHLDTRARIETADMILESCLHSAEDGMRQSRGVLLIRNYAPLLCGFAILDQLGGCYSDKQKPALPSNKSGVIKALDHFSDYASGSSESDAIYLLRNCLVHDSALSGKSHRGDWAIFRYNWEQPEAIRLPATPWDGTAANLTKDRITWVNPRKLTDEISAALGAARTLQQDRPHDLIVQQSKDDILHRFVFWTPKDQIKSILDN